MPWIETVTPERAEGLLKQIYQSALNRTGRIGNIRRAMSLNPPALRASMALYREIMLADSPLSRAQRELLATVVSRVNGCEY